MKRETLTDIAPRWYEFSRCDQDLEQWFESMERQLIKGDIRDIEVRRCVVCVCVLCV